MLLNIAMLLAAAYGAIVLLVFVFQARLIYFPDVGRDILLSPRTVGLEFDDVWLDASPGVRLHGWFVHRAQPKGVALILHGNAGSIALRTDWLRMFHELGYASLIIDYRGYGRSTGSPSEQGTYEDARAAWDHLTRDKGWASRDIVIVGESLGGAVAAELASRTTARALVLQSTFTSVPDLATQLYPFLPVRWLSRFDYGTLAYLRAVAVPVLVAHSPADEIVPFSQGRALYEQAREPKRFIELSGGHNEGFIFVRREWIDALAAFLDQARPAGAAKSS